MEDCVFCDLSNRAEQGIIFEDERCVVVLDKYPVSKGHMLVVSKTHTKDMIEAGETLSAPMFEVARRMAQKAVKKLGASGVNVTTNIGKSAGQLVFHFHIHVIPRYDAPPEGFERHKEPSATEKRDLVSRLK